MGRTDGLKKTPGITKENAREMQRLSQEKRKQNKAERLVMMDVVRKMVTEEDRAAICSALLEKARNADKDAVKMILQLLGELPDEKQTIALNMGMSDADRRLLEKVDNRV